MVLTRTRRDEGAASPRRASSMRWNGSSSAPNSARPAMVRVTPVWVRVNRRWPASSSRSRTRWLIAPGVSDR